MQFRRIDVGAGEGQNRNINCIDVEVIRENAEVMGLGYQFDMENEREMSLG